MNTFIINPRLTCQPIQLKGSIAQTWKKFIHDSEVKIEMHITDDTGYSSVFELPAQSLSFLEEEERRFLADVEMDHQRHTQGQIAVQRRELQAKLKELDAREASLKRKAPHPKTGGKKLSCVAVKRVKPSPPKKDDDSSESEEYENDSDPDEEVSEDLSEIIEAGKKLKNTGKQPRQRKAPDHFRPENYADDHTKTKALVPDEYLSPALERHVRGFFRGAVPPYRQWLRDQDAFMQLWETDLFFLSAYENMTRLWHCGLDNSEHTWFTDGNLHALLLNAYAQNGIEAEIGLLHHAHEDVCAACGQTKWLTMGFLPNSQRKDTEYDVGAVCGKGLEIIVEFLHWLGKGLAELRELGDAAPSKQRVDNIVDDWCRFLARLQNYKLAQ